MVHCYVAQLLNKPKEVWKWFLSILESDIYDIQGGTVPEGIHVGVMGGSVNIVTKGFAGVRLREDRIIIEPKLPTKWRSLKLKFLHKGVWVFLAITKSHISVSMKGQVPIPVEINNKLYYPLLNKTLKVLSRRR